MRAFLLVVTWLVVAALGGAHVLHLAGVTRPVPIDWAWSLLPQLFVPAWLAIVVAVVVGSRSLGAAATLVAAGHLALVLPAMSGAPADVPADAPRVRIATANVLYLNQQLPELLDELESADADVIVLQEVTDRVEVAVERRLTEAYPHQAVNPRDDAFGSMVVSRLPLRDARVLDIAELPMLSAEVRVGDSWLTLWNVHTRAPTRGARGELRDEMLRAIVDRRPSVDGPLVVAGDFTATRWNPAFADLLDADLTDAADAVGHGLRTTFTGSFGLPAEMVLDHVLLSDDVAAVDTMVGRAAGSDHRPLVADLALVD
jgi:endonuclease/exonuclease/phosphatase (EEP) superfamily protein YafD